MVRWFQHVNLYARPGGKKGARSYAKNSSSDKISQDNDKSTSYGLKGLIGREGKRNGFV